jgi:hypothetical protein
LSSGEPTFHEALPEDFGPDGVRWTLFAECLIALLDAYPALNISLVGSYSTLSKLGLEAASIKKLGRFRVTVWPGATEQPGAIRLAFSPKHSLIAARHSPQGVIGRRQSRRGDIKGKYLEARGARP